MSSGSGSDSIALPPSLTMGTSPRNTQHQPTSPTNTLFPTHTKGSSADSQRRKQPSRWTPEEDDFLRQAFSRDKCWGEIAKSLHVASEGRYERSAEQCSQRWSRVIDPRIRKGAWTPEEDHLLHEAVAHCGINSWAKVAQFIVGRTDIQCRTRWLQSKQRESNVNRLRTDQSLHPMHHMQCVDFEYRPDLVRKKKRTVRCKISSSANADTAPLTTTTAPQAETQIPAITTTTTMTTSDDDYDDSDACNDSPHKPEPEPEPSLRRACLSSSDAMDTLTLPAHLHHRAVANSLSPDKQPPDKQPPDKQPPDKQPPDKQPPDKQPPDKQPPDLQSPDPPNPQPPGRFSLRFILN